MMRWLDAAVVAAASVAAAEAGSVVVPPTLDAFTVVLDGGTILLDALARAIPSLAAQATPVVRSQVAQVTLVVPSRVTPDGILGAA